MFLCSNPFYMVRPFIPFLTIIPQTKSRCCKNGTRCPKRVILSHNHHSFCLSSYTDSHFIIFPPMLSYIWEAPSDLLADLSFPLSGYPGHVVTSTTPHSHAVVLCRICLGTTIPMGFIEMYSSVQTTHPPTLAYFYIRLNSTSWTRGQGTPKAVLPFPQ